MKQTQRINPIRLALILGGVLFLLLLVIPRGSGLPELEISQVVRLAEAGRLERIEVRGDRLTVLTTDGDLFKSRKEGSVSILELLEQQGVTTGDQGVLIDVKGEGGSFSGALLSFLPLIFFGGLLFFMLRRSQRNMGQVFSIGKSQAKVVTENRPAVTFDDVAGAEEAKQEMAEIVEFLRDPEKFTRLGTRIPKGYSW